MESMPTVTFSLEDAFYRALEEIGRKAGISPHRVAKEIVVNHLLSLMLDAYAEHKYRNLMQSINMEHKYQDIYVEHKAQTYSSDINIANKAGQDPSNGELLEKLEALEKSVVELRDAVNALAKEFKDFTRKQQDLLNTYTSKTDQVLQRFSQLIEVAESRDERLDKVVELLQKLVEFLKQGSAKVSEEKQRVSGKSARRREDKCENLKKELVLFESEIYGKIRDRDAFFASLERDCEAIIIEGARERVAVEKSFWQQFLEKLSKIGTDDDDKIKKILDNVEYKLFKTLRESALILFDAVEKKWKPVTSIATSTENKYNKEDESWLLRYAPESEET